jgi:ribose 5-phosphate isomerase A
MPPATSGRRNRGLRPLKLLGVPESSDAARLAAARAAVELVEPGAAIGLGSGRAVWAVTALLGERLSELAPLRAAVASPRTEEAAREAGIEVIELDGSQRLSLAIDGADEIDPELGLLKGGGGALLREKIVIAAARRFVAVAEAAKRVDRLGSTRAIPVEIVRFSWGDTRARLLERLESAELRRGDDGEPYLTDEGHYIVDCWPRATGDIAELAASVKAMPGVVEHGLFLTWADLVLLGSPDGGVERIDRAHGRVHPALGT